MTKRTPKLSARTPADLLDAIYAYEGWVRVEGECRTKRVKTLWTLGSDVRKNRYTATRDAGDQS